MNRFFSIYLLFMAAFSTLAGTHETTVGSETQFNIEAATRAYLDRPSVQEKAKSDAYFEGGYWLQLWQFLYLAGVSVLLLQTRLSAGMRDLACRISRFKALQTAGYATLCVLLTAFLSFPLTFYSDFLREHQYGLATNTFDIWFSDWLKDILVTVIIWSILIMVLMGIFRRLERTWHIWGAIAFVALEGLIIVVSPVFIAPLFNQYTPIEKPAIASPVLRLARANGIAADKVWQMDASRQSKRVSANVSGLFGTMRITLNDNLLNRCSHPEIEAIMAHEIGHYVLNHCYKILLFEGVVIVVGFAFLKWGLASLLRRFGPRWNIAGVGDVAMFPLFILLFSTYMFVLTPILNTFVRTLEIEADIFALNAARQPDGFAKVALKLGEYRKMEPGLVEEWIFFDHPSGAARIQAAMRWKAEHLEDDAADRRNGS
jgi:STE24 endopeptidase